MFNIARKARRECRHPSGAWSTRRQSRCIRPEACNTLAGAVSDIWSSPALPWRALLSLLTSDSFDHERRVDEHAAVRREPSAACIPLSSRNLWAHRCIRSRLAPFWSPNTRNGLAATSAWMCRGVEEGSDIPCPDLVSFRLLTQASMVAIPHRSSARRS